MTRRRRPGFTLIEMLVVVTIIGLLASIALPKFRDVRRHATATQILGDFDAMRHAAMNFYIDSGYFPRETRSGRIPRNLARYLPNNYAMKKPQWTLDYENWETKRSSRYSSTGVVIGLSVITPDKALGQTAMRLVGNAPSYTVGNRFTFLISGF